MINTNALRGIIAEKGTSQRKLAEQIGITDKTFYTKMKNGVFDSDEISIMVEILQIKNPMEIFFAKEVT